LASLVYTAASTGERRGELCGLRWSDIDLGTATVTVARSISDAGRTISVKGTKTHQARRLALDPGTVEVLLAQRERAQARANAAATTLSPSSYVWSQAVDSCEPYRPDRVSGSLSLRDRLGLKHITFHGLRHFSASTLSAQGVNVRTIAGPRQPRDHTSHLRPLPRRCRPGSGRFVGRRDALGLPRLNQTLERALRRSSRRQPIDVLYHFSVSSVARMGRSGALDGPVAELNAKKLDDALGPVGWRRDFEEAEGRHSPTGAAIKVAKRFGEPVRTATGRRSTAVPVRQRPEQLPKYLLMLFTADERAHWDFADQAAKAHVDWLLHCSTEDYQANLRRNESLGVLSLFKDTPPAIGEIEAARRRCL